MASGIVGALTAPDVALVIIYFVAVLAVGLLVSLYNNSHSKVFCFFVLCLFVCLFVWWEKGFAVMACTDAPTFICPLVSDPTIFQILLAVVAYVLFPRARGGALEYERDVQVLIGEQK